MGRMNRVLLPLIFFSLIFASGICFADESEIFSLAGTADVLIILDTSGSMTGAPDGSCNADADNNGLADPGSTCNSKFKIAQRAIKALLDANGDGVVDAADEAKLGLRMGYMNFYGCGYTNMPGERSARDWRSGCIKVIKEIGSSYASINTAVQAQTSLGGGDYSTPLADTIAEAKLYFDTLPTCIPHYAVYITDGEDALACDATHAEWEVHPYRDRRKTLAAAKAFADAGYKLFMIGFGTNLDFYMKNTLEWMAYFGGSKNPNVTQTGNTNAITVLADPCHKDLANNHPDGPVNAAAIAPNDPGPGCNPVWPCQGHPTATTQAQTNVALSGYAFTAGTEAQLNQALTSALTVVQQARYSFSVASVSACRLVGENFIYEASFKPSGIDPFWEGHLKKFNINSDGSIGSQVWDAGNTLQTMDYSTRRIYTYMGGNIASFTTAPPGDIKKHFSLQTGVAAQDVLDYIRGNPAKNPDGWRLGDIYRSNPITVGSPSYYYIDVVFPSAFVTFRENMKNRERIIVAGSNDGQFRAFNAGDGSEKWSFIPPNLLPKIPTLYHPSHPTALRHTYFMDGPVTVADVWLGSGDGKSKVANDWHTLLVFSEGRGVRDATNAATKYLWSSSQYCDSETNFNKSYTSVYKYYCGYWAFDVTDTSATTPAFKWLLQPNATQALYLDEPWSKMAMGRVKIRGNEKWVGFIGAGYNADVPQDANRGKGFFVVDLSNGNILWSFTKGGSDSRITSTSMTYSIPASPAIVDTDNDGFVDTAYIGDLGGNIWRFKFCTDADGTACNNEDNWSGERFFQSSTATPIYTAPSVARSSGSTWVFWGTGDKNNPSATGTQDRFFGIKDDNRAGTYTIDQLEDITSGVFSRVTPGWYLNLASNEKVLSDSSVFGGMATWTTYAPYSGSDPCQRAGTERFYAVAMMPVVIGGVTYQEGAGLLAISRGNEVGQRSAVIGAGIAQMPVFSQKPGATGATDVFISSSGGGGKDSSIQSSTAMADSPFKSRLQATAPSAQVIHWLDQRMQ